MSAHRPRRLAYSLLVASFAALLTAGPASAQLPRETAARTVLASGELRFEPTIQAQGWLLTVSGPDGFYKRREFRDAVPRFELVGSAGPLVADGRYKWELRALTPGASPAIQWGSFVVRQGVARLPDPFAVEAPPPIPLGAGPDITGDYYIDGRLAIGSFVTGSESFGFTSFLVKDDNVRLEFEDASTTLSFPTNDWQITINDSSNGGDAYFAIDDLDGSTRPLTIEAGADDNSIYIDDMGRVGIGTTTPGAKLQVEGDFVAGSSRTIKHAFEPVEARAVLGRLLELPITEWSYTSDTADIRHLGPVAEDFFAAFRLGRENRHVAPLDLSGVAFAAIQGLHELVRERDARIEELEESRDELARRLEELERVIRKLPSG